MFLVRHEEEPHMPEDKPQLPEDDIAKLAAWIDAGAPYTRPLNVKPQRNRPEAVDLLALFRSTGRADGQISRRHTKHTKDTKRSGFGGLRELCVLRVVTVGAFQPGSFHGIAPRGAASRRRDQRAACTVVLTTVLSLAGFGSGSAPLTTTLALSVPAAPGRTFTVIVHVPPFGNSDGVTGDAPLILVQCAAISLSGIRRRGRADKAGIGRQQLIDLEPGRVGGTAIGDRHGVAHQSANRDLAR